MINDFASPRIVASPDGSHAAKFLYAGEIRFGPPYYEVELDGSLLRRQLFRKRYFGFACLWSPDSRYLALSEWLSTSEARGPETQVVVIDVSNRQECVVDRMNGGFAEPANFDGSTLFYTRTSYGHGPNPRVGKWSVDLSEWREWGRLSV